MIQPVLHNASLVLAWLFLHMLALSAGFTGCANQGSANSDATLSGTVITENNIAAKVYIVAWDNPHIVLDSAITLKEFEFSIQPEQSWMIIAQDSSGNMAWAGPFAAEEQPDLELLMRPAMEKEIELPEKSSTVVYFHHSWQNTPGLESKPLLATQHLNSTTENTVSQDSSNRWVLRWPESGGRIRLWIQRENARPYYILWNCAKGEPETPDFQTSPMDSLVYSWIVEKHGSSSNTADLTDERWSQPSDMLWVAADSSWRIRARPLGGNLFILEQQWPAAEGWSSQAESWSLHFTDSLNASPYAYAGTFSGAFSDTFAGGYDSTADHSAKDSLCADECWIEELASSNEISGLIRTLWKFQSADSTYRMVIHAKNRVWLLQGSYSDQGELRKLSFDFQPAATDQLLRLGLLWSRENSSDTLKATGFADEEPFGRFWWVQQSDSLFLQPYKPADIP